MILKNLSVLLDNELEYIPSISLQISKQRFNRIQKKIHPSPNDTPFVCEDLLSIHSLIN